MQILDPSKYALALHTTSPQLGLAIDNFSGDSRARSWDLGLKLSTHLHQYLGEFLRPQTWQNLEFIAVAKGPGGFTGTRIGMVSARTLAQQLDIPLYAISSLAAVAWAAMESDSCLVAIQMEARRAQLFVGIYQLSPDGAGLIEYLADTVMTPATWQQTLDKVETNYKLIDAPVDLGSTVTSVLKLAHFDWQRGKRPSWQEALPFYGQHPIE